MTDAIIILVGVVVWVALLSYICDYIITHWGGK